MNKWLFFLSLWFTYIICAAGYLDTIDVLPSLDTARSLLDNHTFETHPREPEWWLYKITKGGKFYSKMGLTMPLLYMPGVLLGRFLSKTTGTQEEMATGFVISLVNTGLTAATISLLYLFLSFEGTANALAISLVFAFGTFLFPYMKTCHREPFEALCLTAVFVLPFIALKKGCWGKTLFFLGGCFFGAAILTKVVLLIPLMPAAYWVFRTKKHFWCFTVPVVLSLIVWFTFSKVVYGGFLDTGYNPHNVFGHNAWRTELWVGVYEQVSGFFIYNPILIVPVFAFVVRVRRLELIDWMAMATCLLQVFLHAKWFSPLGGEALGPRYLVAITPLFAIILRRSDFLKLPKFQLALCSAFLFISILTQTVNVCVKSQEYWTLRSRVADTSQIGMPHWEANVVFLRHKLFGQGEVYVLSEFGGDSRIRISLDDVRSEVGFNFWWIQAPKVNWGKGGV
jgi:hypothetical protein